jgi:hypothetical protein
MLECGEDHMEVSRIATGVPGESTVTKTIITRSVRIVQQTQLSHKVDTVLDLMRLWAIGVKRIVALLSGI